jgi:hypothetical protein
MAKGARAVPLWPVGERKGEGGLCHTTWKGRRRGWGGGGLA